MLKFLILKNKNSALKLCLIWCQGACHLLWLWCLLRFVNDSFICSYSNTVVVCNNWLFSDVPCNVMFWSLHSLKCVMRFFHMEATFFLQIHVLLLVIRCGLTPHKWHTGQKYVIKDSESEKLLNDYHFVIMNTS
jgi:hypothetical protein